MARFRHNRRENLEIAVFRPRQKVNPLYPSFFLQRGRIRERARTTGPRRFILIFSLVSIFFIMGFTYILSNGRPLFGAAIHDVDENDFFFSQYLDDESRETVVGPKGGPLSSPLKLFTYTIGANDSLSKIAEKTGVTLSSLISANNLQDAHLLRVGQQLEIPNQKGIYHNVQRGESVAGIAKRYKVEEDDIRQFNALVQDTLKPGERLFIPGAQLPQTTMERVLGLIFRRPVDGGWISSSFGYRRNPFTYRHEFHPGIDIALPYWTRIRAIRSGKVVFSGWKGGYGKLVVIDHARGYSSFYGHQIKYIVRSGQWVQRGQLIGYVGSTGYSSGPHLHFELRRWGKLLNPFHVQGFRRAFNRGY